MISSLEKCFWDDELESKREVNNFSMFRNERLSFQVAYRTRCDNINHECDCAITLDGELAGYARVRLVSNVLNMFPTYNVSPGGAFIKTTPGAYPDLLRPFIMPGKIALTASVFAGSMPCCSTYHVTARYIAPVLMKVKPNSLAISLATVDFPEAAGPSIAMAGGFIHV